MPDRPPSREPAAPIATRAHPAKTWSWCPICRCDIATGVKIALPAGGASSDGRICVVRPRPLPAAIGPERMTPAADMARRCAGNATRR
jgi:hypothetical protein